MKRIQNILLLALLAIIGNAFGQERDLEKDLLVGKVKTYELFSYDFDISDSINHDDFMNRFYQCGFDVDKMLRFADSIKANYNRKRFRYYYEYDTMGYHTRLVDDDSVFYWNEYDAQGRVLKRFREENHVSKEIASNKYDDNGLPLEERWENDLTRYVYNSDGKLLERKEFKGDSIVGHWKARYDSKGVLRKSNGFISALGYHEVFLSRFDSRGNITFDITDHDDGRKVKMRKRYKYDKNDSIIKVINHKTIWYNIPMHEDEFWEETDSIENVTNYANYKLSYSKKKDKFKSVKRIIRNTQGYAVKTEILCDGVSDMLLIINEYDSVGQTIKCEDLSITKSDTICESIVEYKYDELGRLIERTARGDTFRTPGKTVWKYHKDTEFYSYIGRYSGENYDLVQESLFFFDEKGNCIAHIQWMPDSPSREYYLMVYKIGYYE